jgi:TolB-like protein/DNA-binding winged helix-turn-helix (wHTH) protein/Tfp pilus assembly protein PilF
MGNLSSNPRQIRFGAFEVDLRSSEMRKSGMRLKLAEQPFRILAMLLENPGEMVTRDELRERLWPGDTFVDFDHGLNNAVLRLREALGDSSEHSRFVETVPRRGYRFIAPVEEVTRPDARKPDSESPKPVNGSGHLAAGRASVPPSIRISSLSLTKRTLFIAGLVTLATALFAVVTLHFVRAGSAVDPRARPLQSLVVLPFENLSEDKDQQYFTDGMTDELTAHLAKIRQLRVISRTSAMGYKGTHKTLSEIARDLNVDAIVEGTVLRSGNRVRITAELVQVSTDRHLWAETYESPIGDVLALQSQVATAIANEIRVNLTPEEQRSLANSRPVSAEAYENYLKGRYYWNKRSEEGLRKAIEYFQAATEKEPGYALAFAGLADCYSIIGSAIIGDVSAQEVAAKARAAALKATQLDPALAEAQTSLATVRFNYDWDWNAASTGFQRSIELNPGYATAYQRYSLYLMAMGRTQESLFQMNRARDLDPLSISTNFSLGWRLFMARQYDQAIEQLRNTLEMDPNFALPRSVLGQAYERKGLYPQAISELQKAVTVSHGSPAMLGALGHAWASAGNKAEAEKILVQMNEASKTRYVSPFYVAMVYAGLHQDDNALAWLDKAYNDRSNAVIFLKVDQAFDGLRSNARFQALLTRLAQPKP